MTDEDKTKRKNEPLRKYQLTDGDEFWLEEMLARGKPNSAWEELGSRMEFEPHTVRVERARDVPATKPLAFTAQPTRRVHPRATEEVVAVAARAYDAAGRVEFWDVARGMRTALTAVFDHLERKGLAQADESRRASDEEAVRCAVEYTGCGESDREDVVLEVLRRLSALRAYPEDQYEGPVEVPTRDPFVSVSGNLSISGGLSTSASLQQRDELAARGAEAPRVTLSQVQSLVASERYFVDETLTICSLTLTNGFKVTGESAAADPRNFDPDKGRTIAREKAIGNVWPLAGYLLREELHRGAHPAVVRCKLSVSGVMPVQSIKYDGHDNVPVGGVDGAVVTMHAVWEGATENGGKAAEDRVFSEATPSASFQLHVRSRDALRELRAGRTFYVDFLPA